MQSAKKNRLAFADGLRGLAALWVVLYHMAEGSHIEAIKTVLPSYLYQTVFEFGHLGVPIFFVLSGYVMGLTAHNVTFNSKNSFKFLARRITRLTPPYYFAIVFAVSAMLFKAKLLGSPITIPSVNVFTQHAFFLQGIFESPQINIVFWTLCIEVQFYLIFALLIYISDTIQCKLLPNHNIRNYILIAAAMIAISWPLGLIETSFWPGGFIGFWYSFLSGTLTCLGWKKGGRLIAIALAYNILILIIGLKLLDSFAITAGITAILLLIASHRNKMGEWLNWKWLQWVGIISYSLYLLHNPITGASFRLVNKFTYVDSLLNDLLGMILCLSASFFISYITYLIVEKPSIKMSHYFKAKA